MAAISNAVANTCCSPSPLLRRRRATAMAERAQFLLAIAVVVRAFGVAAGGASLGVNYGQVADNLPPPQAAALLLRALNATRVKLYDADARVLSAFAGSGADFTVGLPDRLVPRLATDPSAAAAWVRANVLPHIPATSITAITVGNEVLSGNDSTMLRSLLPAMQSLHAALAACNLTARVAVTTAHSLAVLSSSFPPSSAAFRRELLPYITPLLAFLAKTNSPFLINAYPYFAYKADPGRVDLNYVLFEANAGVGDPATGLHYDNMLHAQVDAVRAAICRANYGKPVEIRVSETGWPSQGDDDEAGATPENAARYNGNLMRLVAQGKGTPAAPGEALQVYVFALFNEDMKPGPASERHYGLFKPDGTPAYDVGVKAPTIGGSWKGRGNGTTGGGAGGLVVAEGPGGADGAGPGTGFYTVSAAAHKVKRWQCWESLLFATVFLAMASGLCWS
ncbi:glucan endo-1,3-beta-glucosidase 14-like [Oryza brachyantha]|uniref:glucan endo-1,3-beta-glucosidase 14-like n=1 Tax=Oryza brachyantha TaxID=4533 RepID=UPI001ADB82CE|nr:glucan endo-1,3-beta-glucosidase 14-like [Oryza brachyantha]